jgi:hypothetical protein
MLEKNHSEAKGGLRGSVQHIRIPARPGITVLQGVAVQLVELHTTRSLAYG